MVLDRVPVMGLPERNEAKRLILLVDALYDARRRIVLSAEGPVEKLYTAPKGTEAFEFQRTVSRLIEMRSASYGEGEAAG